MNWINVNEVLPSKSGIYLVYLSDGRQKIMGFTESLMELEPYNFIVDKSGWYMFDSDYGIFEVQNVTHWMPLPQPPSVI